MSSRWNVSRFAIRRPAATLAFWAAIVAAGIAAFASLKYTLLPDLSLPLVIVEAAAPQRAGALATEAAVTVPLEALLARAGAATLRSVTSAGKTTIALAFAVGNPLEERRRAVAALLAAGPVPRGVRTTVTPVDFNAGAVVTYALTEPDQRRLLIDTALLARSAVPAFLAVPGVLRADIIGADPATAVRMNGARALMLRIVKKGGANTLTVAAGVERVAARVRAILQIPLAAASDEATYVREASHAATEALGLAMALAVAVVFPFLRDARATLITAIAIPTSLAATAIVMALLHFNLETITLLALTLVTGVIVDDAIVDVENIARHVEAGEDAHHAAETATDEIGLTVTAATLTIVAVFLPIGLMTGTLGQFFRPFGITASVAVLASLAVARTLSPMLAAAWLRGRPSAPVHVAPPWYLLALNWSLRHRPAVIGGALASFIAGLALVPLIPKGFVPHLDRGTFLVSATVTHPGAHAADEAVRAAGVLDAAIRRDRDVENVLAAVGDRGDPAVATLTVSLRAGPRSRTIDVENRVRERLPHVAGAVTSVEDVPFVDNGVAKPLSLVVADADLTTLARGARELARALARERGFVDVTAGGLDGSPGAPVKITHEGRRRIVDVQADLRGLTVGDATARAAAVARRVLPASSRFDFGGQSADSIATFGSFGVTLGASIVAIVAVLGVLFRRWQPPLVIVTALPLSVVGALVALYVVRADFGLISLMGVIFLFGLVNKNAILLVDAAERRRRAGVAARAAVLEAGAPRFRPIVMTTAATIFGMLPIAAGFGAGAELRAPMAVAIIGGLLSSTLLSLLVIPVAYTYVHPAR